VLILKGLLEGGADLKMWQLEGPHTEGAWLAEHGGIVPT
jgi:hypothetical protein